MNNTFVNILQIGCVVIHENLYVFFASCLWVFSLFFHILCWYRGTEFCVGTWVLNFVLVQGCSIPCWYRGTQFCVVTVVLNFVLVQGYSILCWYRSTQFCVGTGVLNFVLVQEYSILYWYRGTKFCVGTGVLKNSNSISNAYDLFRTEIYNEHKIF